MESILSAGHQALTFEQVQKLNRVLTDPIEIQPPNNFPPLAISPADIVKAVRQRLLERDITIRDIRLNGSGASHVLCEGRPELHFNDVDLIFGVSVEREYDFRIIKEEVLMSLLEFFPKDVSTEKISGQCLEESYVRKMVLVYQGRGGDQWSLVSLGDGVNKSIELKFVNAMKRQFEFSVDSFHIILDSFFDFDSCCTEESPVSISRSFFPTVQALSVYGDFSEALYHLNNQLIDTIAPEEIRGGGLLKYCYLLVSGYRPANPEQMMKLEPYMCSRFFIDFPTVESLYYKLYKYISTQFLQGGRFGRCLEFLNTLQEVVSGQAMCLMEAKRRETISVICNLRLILPQHLFLPPMVGYPYMPPPLPVSPLHHRLPPVVGSFVPPPPVFAADPSRHSPPPFGGNFPPNHWPSGPMRTTQVR